MLKVFLTVDVECYSGDYERQIHGAGLGLAYLLKTCADHGCRATFFVEAMGGTRWGMEGVKGICSSILAGGHEVQLHVHPVVAALRGVEDKDDILWKHDEENQRRFIEEGLTVLSECGVPKVSALRAGDFAADSRTLTAMSECGLTLSSNRDLDMKSSIRSRINDSFPIQNDLAERDGIRDLPVSVLRSPFPFLDGRYRHMEIAAMGTEEMCDGLCRMSSAGYTCATILTHADEFFTYSNGGAAAVQKNCRRLERLLAFVDGNQDMRMATIGECMDSVVPSVQPAMLIANPLYSFIRVLQQARERVRKR